MMVQLNLLPDVKKEFLQAQRMRNTVISISIFVSIVFVGILVILGVLMGGQAIQKNLVTNDIKENAAKVQDTPQLNEYLTVQNQLSQIGALKDAQPIYSRLFDYLQQLNPASPNNVELNSVKILGTAGATTSTATSTDVVASAGSTSVQLDGSIRDFAALAVFKTTLQSATISYTDADGEEVTDELLFTTVSVRDASISRSSEEGRVSFTIDLVFNAEAFASNITEVLIDVPNKTTSDADRNSPQDVFGNGDNNSTTSGGND